MATDPASTNTDKGKPISLNTREEDIDFFTTNPAEHNTNEGEPVSVNAMESDIFPPVFDDIAK